MPPDGGKEKLKMRKFLIVMMCIIMAVCFMPTVAMAEVLRTEHPDDNSEQCTNCVASVISAESETKYYDALTAAISEAEAEATVKLLDDIEYSSATCFDIDKQITLDLNGKTITAVSNGSCSGRGATHFIRVKNGGIFTVTDTSESKEGCITATYGASSQLLVVEIMSGGKFTLDAGKIQNAASTNYGSSTVYVREGGTFILDGGTVAAVAAKKRAYPVFNNGIMEMKNGLITSNDSASEGILQKSTQPLKINGGNINVTHKVSISISQGKAMPIISGGKFSGVLDVKWIAEGKYAVYDGTDSAVVDTAPETYNACINQKLYFTGETGADDAVKALDAGNTIVLRKTPSEGAKTRKSFSSGKFSVVLENGASFDSNSITVAAGYKVVSATVNESTTDYSVVVDEELAQARIGDTYYTTLGNANANAKNGDTIVVLKDITGLTSAISVSKELTIDLNGHSIQGKKAVSSYDKAGAVIKTYTYEAKLTIIDSSNSEAGSVENIGVSGRAVYADKGTVSIEAGSFGAATSAVGANDGAKLTVKAGTFTSDPSAYVADGYVVLPSDKDGYAFMVTKKPEAQTDAKPATGSTAVDERSLSDSMTDVEKDVVKETAASVQANGGELAAAANAAVGEVTETQVNQAETAYAASGISGEGDLNIYAQTYLSITPKEYKAPEGGEPAILELDIQPMYRIVASKEASAENLKVAGEVGDEETANAVVLEGSEKKLTNIQTMEVKIILPDGFPTTDLKVKHTASSGIYYYIPKITAEDGHNVATFTVTNGFSPFEFLVDSRAATVQFSETDTRNFNAANVNDAFPTATAPSGQRFGGWTFDGIEGTYTELTDDLLTALAEKGGTVTATPYFYTPNYDGGGSTVTTPLDTAKSEASKAVSEYVKSSDYEAAEQAEIKAIIDKAAAEINNAKTEAEVKKIETEAKADIDKLETAADKAIIRTIQNTKFIARSKTATLRGRKAIRVTWNKPQDIEFDGYEIFRSSSRYKGFGTKPIFTAQNQKYTNNKELEVGKTYYYKVRAYKYVNGKKVYTQFSTKAWRTVR